MQIRNVKRPDIGQIINYQLLMFPERASMVKKLVPFWFSKTEKEYDESFLLEDDGIIRGELLFSSMNYFFNGVKNNDFWAFDLIVDENLRKEGHGLKLMMTAFKEHNTCFCTGSGPLALKIELKLGFYMIGEIRKYVRVVNPIYICNSIRRGDVYRDKYPDYIVVDDVKFEKVNTQAMPNFETAFNDDLLEIGRDAFFLAWRYKDLHEYVIYKQEASNNFFVLRSFIKKSITAMALIDFRCPIRAKGDYSILIKAAINITKRLRLPILVTGSSLSICDDVLENNGFKSIGRPRPIITKDKRFKDYHEKQNNRNFCLVTLADSDGEVLL